MHHPPESDNDSSQRLCFGNENEGANGGSSGPRKKTCCVNERTLHVHIYIYLIEPLVILVI